jgi:hypothetical protein
VTLSTIEEDEHDPADLGDADRRHIGPGRLRPCRIVPRDLPPQEHQRDAHDHIARDHHAVVERVAVVDRLEQSACSVASISDIAAGQSRTRGT